MPRVRTLALLATLLLLATEGPSAAAAPPSRTPATGPARWEILSHPGGRVPAFVVGSWQAMAGGALTPRDLVDVSPPEIVAGLGLATVYGPGASGWFLSAGPRVVVKTTDEAAGFPTRSYESWAQVGWAVGVTSGSLPAARVWWECNSEKPLAFANLVAKAVAEAPGAGAWIVAGQVEFTQVRGQSLRRSPLPGGIHATSDKTVPGRSLSEPVTDTNRSALVVAVVASPGSPVGRQLSESFLPKDALPVTGSGPDSPSSRHVVLAHYALFMTTAPRMDRARTFQAIWPKVGAPSSGSSLQFETVRRVLDASVARAHLTVWAIDSLQDYPFRDDPDLVDPTELDRTILADQAWAKSNPLFREPIYDRPRLLLRRAAAEGIVRVNAHLATRGYRLKLYDAYRPLSVTQKLLAANPSKSGDYLANPTIGSRHNRGAALDCTLTDMDGRDVEMQTPYLTLDERSNRTAPMNEACRKHLAVLTAAMATEGFTPLGTEWWHYDAPGWKGYRVLNRPLWPEDEPAAPATAPEPPAPPAATPSAVPPAANGSRHVPLLGGVALATGVALLSLGSTRLLRRRK